MALALAFYLYTLQPSLAWGDGTRLQREAITGESYILAEMVRADFAYDPFPFARLGVAAWDHPLYVMVAHTLVRLLPWSRLLWVVNAVSAVFAAAAVALVARLVLAKTGSIAASLIAAAMLAVSHTFWFHASTPEVYSLLTCLLLAGLWCWHRFGRAGSHRWLFGAGLALGLAASNHVLAFLALPALGLYWLLGRRALNSGLGGAVKMALAAAAGFGLGFVPFVVQLLRMLRTFPLGEVTGPAVGTTFLAGLLSTSPVDLARSLATFAVLLSLQFSPVGVALGMWGIGRGATVSPWLWRMAVAGLGVYGLFGVLYQVSDQFAFFHLAYVFFAFAIGLGVCLAAARLSPTRRFWGNGAAVVSLVAMPLLYAAAPRLAQAAGVTDATLGIPAIGVGARNGLEYYVNPNKRGDYGAETFGRSVLSALPEDALVLAEWYTDTDEYFVLRYFMAVEGLRPDVRVEGWPTDDPFQFDAGKALRLIEAEVGRRPIYLASLSETYYDVSGLRRDYCIVPEHSLYRLYPRARAPDANC